MSNAESNNLKQKSINGIFWNLLEKIGIQLIRLILGVTLARLLTPADYGLIGMITVFIAISLIFIDSGFGMAYIQKQDADDVDASTIFYFNLFVSVFFFIILWFSAPLIANFYNENQLIDLIRVLSIVLIINSFGLIQRTKLTKNVDFKKKTLLMMVSAVISGIAGIIAAILNYGVWSLVIQRITQSSIESIGLYVLYRWTPLPYFKIKSLKSMLSFSSWSLSLGILNTIFDNIYIIVIGKFFPAAQLGFYTKAKQFEKTITRTTSNAIGTVAFPVFSKLQADKIALKNACKKFIKHTIFFVAPIAAVFFVIADPLFLILLTEKWMPIVPYFRLLLIAGILHPIHMINVQTLIAQGKMKLNFNLAMVKNTLRVVNIIIMYQYGVIYIIYGEILLSYIGLVINTYFTKKLIGYGLMEQLKDLSIMLLASFLLASLGIVLMNEFINDYLKILFGVLFVGSFYLIIIFIFNRKILLDNLDIIKSKFFKSK